MSSRPPIACSLEPGELSDRLAQIAAIGDEALIATNADGALRFRSDPETRARLEAIINAEARCCPFLELDLRERGGELVLTIAAPDEAEPVARDLAAAFAPR